jgi:hypothetical protein
VLEHPVAGSVLLIDDMRLFTGRADYPAVSEVRNMILRARPGWRVEVRDDVLRAHEPKSLEP